MDAIKNYAGMLLGLLVALIVLMVSLRFLSKAPVVGAIAQDAQNLASQGTL